jgi:hypothetical protein
VGPRAGLRVVERETLLPLSGIETRLLGSQARGQVTISTELTETDFGWLSMSLRNVRLDAQEETVHTSTNESFLV